MGGYDGIRQRLAELGIRAHDGELFGHDLGDRGGVGIHAAVDDAPEHIALGEDTEQTAAFHNRNRADVLLVHQPDCLTHRCVRRYRVDVASLAGENAADRCLHGIPSTSMVIHI